jgi:uncharacterized protein HemY
VPRYSCLLSFALLLAASVAFAEDEVYTVASKDKPLRGTIKAESPRGITLDKQDIAAEEIHDIFYDTPTVEIRVKFYRKASDDEKAALNPAKEEDRANRDKLLTSAIKMYEETIEQLKDRTPLTRRHLEYKIAYLTAVQAQDEGTAASGERAIAKLRDFKTKHPQSWQLGPCLRLLAQLQLDLKQYAAAEQTYQELADADVSEEIRQEATLLAVQTLLYAGKTAAAEKRLKQLISTFPADSRPQLRAKVMLAECIGVGGKLAEAKKTVQQVLSKAKDKGLRAAAYNTMGYCYFVHKQWHEARWEFLWVDVIYNQDKREHAKALFYLAEIFAALGEGERARECLEQLRTDRDFAGSDYQRRVLKTAGDQ